MGCCASRPTLITNTPIAPPPPTTPPTSQPPHPPCPPTRAPRFPSPAPSDRSSAPPLILTTSRASRSRRRNDPSRVVNKPLRLHAWGSSVEQEQGRRFHAARSRDGSGAGAGAGSRGENGERRVWERSELVRHREEFFDTRVTGHAEIWLTLRSVISTLHDAEEQHRFLHGSPTLPSRRQPSSVGSKRHVLPFGGSGREEPEVAGEMKEALATAQSMLDATGITVPTGDLVDGVYDESGGFYSLPEEIVCDPPGVVEDDATSSDVPAAQESKFPVSRDDATVSAFANSGQKHGVEGGSISVKTRLSDRGGRDLKIEIPAGTSVKEFIEIIRSKAGVEAKCRIRIAYAGRLLDEKKSLKDQGWIEGHVVNTLVLPVPS